MLCKISLIIMFITSALSGITAVAQARVDFKEYTLSNGLQVILHQDKTNPIITLNIWYHVGAKDEDPTHTGFAHLFEHMMFQGSQNVDKTGHFSYINNAGGTLNGTTNQDRTNYFETVPSNQLELILWLEADRMGYLNVNQENFDNQREVVKEEKRQRYDNVPYGDRFVYIMKSLFPEHPYRWLAIGDLQHLTDAPLSYAQEFYNNFYGPNNAVLVVSGDIEYDEAYKLVEKYFGDLKPVKVAKKDYPEVQFNQGERRETVTGNVQLPAVTIAYKVPGIKTEERYALEILADILGSGKSSRLYQELVYKNKLAKTAGNFIWNNELAGSFIFNLTGFKDTKPEDLESKAQEVIDKIKSELVTDTELQKVKNETEAGFINSLSTTGGKADQLARYKTFFKDANRINTDVEGYLKVTKEDVLNAAKKYLNNENRYILYYLPKPKSN